MSRTITIGLDIAKHVFQVHGVDAAGEVVVRRKLRRSEILVLFKRLAPCLVGIEACATAHHWARALMALGHEVKLMPPSYVKPYVKRQKNDMTDAEAICEAVTRPTMRFVPVKSVEQQSVLSLHRARDLLVRQRTGLINALRAHLAEYGIAVPQGTAGRNLLATLVEDEDFDPIPPLARAALSPLVEQIKALEAAAHELEMAIKAWHRASPNSRRLSTIPRHWPYHGERACGLDPRPVAVPLGSAPGGLARAHAAREFQWRQAAARPDLEAGGPLSAPSPGGWRHSGVALCRQQPSGLIVLAVLGGSIESAQTIQGRRPVAGEQACPDRLGGDGARRGVPSGAGSLSEAKEEDLNW